MTQEQKDLLLKDLCSRLPYGVIIEHCLGIIGTLHDLFVHWFYDKNDNIYNREACTSTFFGDVNCDIDKFKPYLFPMSSMTDEQKEEHKDLLDNQYSFDANGNIFTLQDFYCKYHLDYRGLIPLGLAKDATGLNIY